MSLPVDRLSAVMERFRVRARLFHAGPLCGTTRFDAQPGRAFLHVLRSGAMEVTHRERGRARRITVDQPALLFYPRPHAHAFHNPPVDGSDFACATLDFEGGERHPIAYALPEVLVVPLREVGGLEHTLALLFAETERLRCGQRLLADRLFEVLLLQLLRWMLDHPDAVRLPAGLLTGLADARLARSLVAVHEQPGEPWNLERMAAQAGMSRSAFAQAFRDAVGDTPASYVLRWRIADQFGYGTPASFSRAFALAEGMSPRDWLKRERAALAEHDGGVAMAAQG